MNQIKLIIFDLDGILLDKDIHFKALNHALERYTDIQLSHLEHEAFYDGRPTIQKLKLLEEYKGLDPKLFDRIWQSKQYQTRILMLELIPNPDHTKLLALLCEKFRLSLASNAIKDTVDISLTSLGIKQYLNPLISNEDIRTPKPYPECYWRCMEFWKILPRETLIIEDSPVGIEGAHNSGGHVYECIESKYLNYDGIMSYIHYCNGARPK